MAVATEQLVHLPHMNRVLREKLRKEDFSRVTSCLDTLFQGIDDSNQSGALVEANDVNDWLEFARLLRRVYTQASGTLTPQLRTYVFRLLDFARDTTLLKKIYDHRQENDWLDAVLDLASAVNYTVGDLFYQRVQTYGDKPLFRVPGGQPDTFSWNDVRQQTEAIAGGFLALQAGDASGRVAMLSENRPEMAFADLACLSAGIVNVLLPTNAVASEIEHMLEQSQATVALVSNANHLSKLLNARKRLPALKHLIAFDAQTAADAKVMSLEHLIERGTRVSEEDVRTAVQKVKPTDLATIMYTSGTTEAPKGIRFTQMNLVSKRFARALALPEIAEHDTFVCYLPLYHTFGRYLEMLACVFWGSTYVFARSARIDTLIQHMQEFHPTVFISIPKKWMQLYETITENVDVDVDPESKIRRQVEQVTGGHLRWGLSAAGYLDPDIFRFFRTYGVELMSGFGMTEATGGITMTPPGGYRENSVGQALPGIEIRLADDGEMLIRGPYVTPGYVDDDRSAFRGDWLCTGDVFTRDDDGYYEIVDRKKEIYKNIRGETIAPQKIENFFRDFESVKRVFLVGDHREYNTLLLYPNYDYEQVNLREMDLTRLREFFSSLIVSVNRFLAPYERIIRFAIIDRDFEAERGELTPKGTFKRKVITENFRDVIEEMYSRDHAAFHFQGFEIRIPHWFLREKGLTTYDLQLEDDRLHLKPFDVRLTLRRRPDKAETVRVGTLDYEVQGDFLDLSTLFKHPALWLGNLELVDFAGDVIYRWNFTHDEESSDVHLRWPSGPLEPVPEIRARFQQGLQQDARDLPMVHLAAHLMFTGDPDATADAITYLARLLGDDGEAAKAARAVLLRASNLTDTAMQRRAFDALLREADESSFRAVVEKFVLATPEVLDEDIEITIRDLDLSRAQLYSLFALLRDHVDTHSRQRIEAAPDAFVALIRFITVYGVHHPVAYKAVRAELYKLLVSFGDSRLRDAIQGTIDELQRGLRAWLGPNQEIAVDHEGGQEYRWQDVTVFADDVAPEDRERLFAAIARTPLLREAIFIFSEATLVRLQDIAHRGIWVSFLGARHGKSVYRVSVQTRYYGAFDLAINLNQTLSPDDVQSEITWLICAGPTEDRDPLVEDFGGYWPKYDLWTEEFIAGETVQRFLRRLDRQPDPERVERIALLWPYFVWSGLSAYIDFWDRTGRRYQIADPSPVNVIVPSDDYHVGFRIVSISSRKPAGNLIDMILEFRQHFIDTVESRYPALHGSCSWHVIFSAFLEVLGEHQGVKLIQGALNSSSLKSKKAEKALLRQKLQVFIEAVESQGFLPKRLHFAIQRYRRWSELNASALPQARMQTLQELYTTYNLADLETRYPGVRLQLFRDTVFAESDRELRNGLNRIIRLLKARPHTEEEIVERIHELHESLSLNAEETFFFTRMTYPHLGPKDSAELISMRSHGVQKTDLVVFIQDVDDNTYSVRHPASPKEIARLHHLFTVANLQVEFRPEHQYLVVLNDRQNVIGGIFYRETGEDHVHLEKIVVDERYRRKGISDGLLKEFFNRLQAHGIKVVTVGFLRPEFFYRYGFRIDRSYGNMVKRLEPEDKKEDVDAIVLH